MQAKYGLQTLSQSGDLSSLYYGFGLCQDSHANSAETQNGLVDIPCGIVFILLVSSFIPLNIVPGIPKIMRSYIVFLPPQTLWTEAWLVIVSQNQKIVRCAVWVCDRDETAGQHAHHGENWVAKITVLRGGFVY